MIYWHKCFGKLVIDRGSENKKVVKELKQRYGIKKVVVLTYYPQANSMIEKQHKFIVNTFPKVSDGGSVNWVQNLLMVL